MKINAENKQASVLRTNKSIIAKKKRPMLRTRKSMIAKNKD